MYALKFSMGKVEVSVHKKCIQYSIVYSSDGRSRSHTGLHKLVPVAEDLECRTAHNHSLSVPTLSSARRLGWALWTYTSPHCLET